MVTLEVDGERQRLAFSACHVIQGHAKCGRMHGHNYFVSVSLEGEPDNGLLMDYGPLKDAVRGICKELDHRVLLPESLSTAEDGQVIFSTHGKFYSFPKGDTLLLPLDVISTERLSKYILGRLLETIDLSNVRRVRVRVDESPGQGAWSEMEI